MKRPRPPSCKNKTYNTEDSLVVTHPTTNSAVTGLSMGERTGSRVFQYLWLYVIIFLLQRLMIHLKGDADGFIGLKRRSGLACETCFPSAGNLLCSGWLICCPPFRVPVC